MDKGVLLNEIETLANKLGVKLYDVKATLPNGETRTLKVVPHACQYILDKYTADHPGTVYELPDSLFFLKN